MKNPKYLINDVLRRTDIFNGKEFTKVFKVLGISYRIDYHKNWHWYYSAIINGGIVEYKEEDLTFVSHK